VGDDWHRALLANATIEIEHVRPAILGRRAFDAADELRRLRHFVRHAYAASLDLERLRSVAARWLGARAELAGDLDAFASFLRELARRLEAG
jgi:hypothetical protein